MLCKSLTKQITIKKIVQKKEETSKQASKAKKAESIYVYVLRFEVFFNFVCVLFVRL